MAPLKYCDVAVSCGTVLLHNEARCIGKQFSQT
jgi:hypothetical protein